MKRCASTSRVRNPARYWYAQDGQRVEQRFAVKIKMVYAGHSVASTIAAGLEQIASYGDKCNADEIHLVVVDSAPSETKPWTEKIFKRKRKYQGRSIAVWGM